METLSLFYAKIKIIILEKTFFLKKEITIKINPSISTPSPSSPPNSIHGEVHLPQEWRSPITSWLPLLPHGWGACSPIPYQESPLLSSPGRCHTRRRCLQIRPMGFTRFGLDFFFVFLFYLFWDSWGIFCWWVLWIFWWVRGFRAGEILFQYKRSEIL